MNGSGQALKLNLALKLNMLTIKLIKIFIVKINDNYLLINGFALMFASAVTTSLVFLLLHCIKVFYAPMLDPSKPVISIWFLVTV